MEYAYDALGRRIRKIDRVANPDETTLYYYNNNWQVLAETDENGTQIRDYVYGNYIDEVLLKTEDGDDLYYAHNHIYSVVALIDDQGNVVERYEYDAYGKPYFYDGSFNSRNQTAYNNVILFCGYRFDEELDKYHIRHRELEPYTGRWMSHDPLGIVPNGQKPNEFNIMDQFRDGLNIYEYVKSRPTMLTDAFGLCNQCGECIAPSGKKYHLKGYWLTTPLLGKTEDGIDKDPDYISSGKQWISSFKIMGVASSVIGAGASGAKELASLGVRGLYGVACSAGQDKITGHASVSECIPGTIDKFAEAVKSSQGFDIWVRISWDECEPCSWKRNTGFWGKAKGAVEGAFMAPSHALANAWYGNKTKCKSWEGYYKYYKCKSPDEYHPDKDGELDRWSYASLPTCRDLERCKNEAIRKILH
ncbi:MAG: hypothetical protein K8R53_15625 [Bacteroidales bacterium]|nr:hypothetical protein [Bacteroidales bacterium]